jgi:hypothetical protein
VLPSLRPRRGGRARREVFQPPSSRSCLSLVEAKAARPADGRVKRRCDTLKDKTCTAGAERPPSLSIVGPLKQVHALFSSNLIFAFSFFRVPSLSSLLKPAERRRQPPPLLGSHFNRQSSLFYPPESRGEAGSGATELYSDCCYCCSSRGVAWSLSWPSSAVAEAAWVKRARCRASVWTSAVACVGSSRAW